jgi:hypothetical protein
VEQGGRRAFLISKGWIQAVVLVVLCGFFVLGLLAWHSDVLRAKLMVLVLVGVLLALHVLSPTSRAVSDAVAAASLVVLWLGVKLTYG